MPTIRPLLKAIGVRQMVSKPVVKDQAKYVKKYSTKTIKEIVSESNQDTASNQVGVIKSEV